MDDSSDESGSWDNDESGSRSDIVDDAGASDSAEERQGAGRLLLVEEKASQVGVRPGVGDVALLGPLCGGTQCRFCLLGPVLGGKREAKIFLGFEVARIDLEGFGKGDFGFVELILGIEAAPEAVEDIDIARRQSERHTQPADGIVVVI